MTRGLIIQIISFFLYLFIQVFFLKNAVLFHTAFCFLYVAYLLSLPVETNPLMLMVIGFLMGFLIDTFYDSLGLHAFASVFIMYIRNFWLSNIIPQGGYDSNSVPALGVNGLQWYLVYMIPMVFIHQALLFFVEMGGFSMFWFTLWKVIASTLFTASVIIIVQFLFPDRSRR